MIRGTRLRTTALGALALGVALAAATAAAPSPVTQEATRKLGFTVTLRQSGPFTVPCPGDVPDLSAEPTTACIPFTGTGSVRGLGTVTATHTEVFGLGPATCAEDSVKPLATTGHLRVAGKGDIAFAFVEGVRCTTSWWLPETLEFTITGGTGRFAGASGKGTRELWIAPLNPGEQIWVGTLEVPGLVFDVTAPKLHGAGAKTVRTQNGATSARVTFMVTATDGVDGSVPVSCRPGSGSRFAIGRTTVRCHAADSSGNAATAEFTVTVKRRR